MSPFQWWLRDAQNLALVTNLTEGRAVLSRVLASLFVLPFIQAAERTQQGDRIAQRGRPAALSRIATSSAFPAPGLTEDENS